MHMKGAPVEIREVGPDVGKGLFAAADIRKGAFIAEYTGTKIPTKVADALDTRYLFELDEDWTIDGESEHNIARWINHCCEPNAEAETHDDHILIFATTRIKKGEEITIDYGDEYYDEFIRPVGCKCRATKHH